jgi:hypothetical protein
VNRIFKPVTYILATVYFLVDAVFIAVAKPVGLACQALGAQKPGTLDQITPAIPIARTVFGSCDHPGTG